MRKLLFDVGLLFLIFGIICGCSESAVIRRFERLHCYVVTVTDFYGRDSAFGDQLAQSVLAHTQFAMQYL